MKARTQGRTQAEKQRSEALRLLCEDGIAEPADIWEKLESLGIHVTPGVVYQAISHYNQQPRTTDRDANAVMDEDKEMSLKDVEMVAAIAEKAGGVRELMRLLRTMEQVLR
jgi:chemotaxis response regulator CheB